MEGVYIKGISMPKSCWDCFGWHDGWCIINQKIEGYRTVTHSCPLIKVAPHGRLIDADVMKTRIESSDYHTIEVIQQWIDEQPTVIESEA